MMGPVDASYARIAFLLVALLFSTTPALHAQTLSGDSTNATNNRSLRMQEQVAMTLDSLNLTDRQKEKVQPILENSFAQRSAIMEKHGMDPTDPDARRRPGYRTMRTMRKEMEKVQHQTEQQLRTILNDEQIARWKQIEDDRRERMRERMRN